jgi:N-acetyl-alpha-D-muramate 1-phosphate uridylyltransferase
MQCVVLAGGRGTRLGPLAQYIPKNLIRVLGHPFAAYQLHWLVRQGVSDVIMCVGHLGELIRIELGDGTKFGLRIRYVQESERLLGTGGALRLAYEDGLLQQDFLVTYGDSLLDLDIADLITHYRNCGAPALMSVLRNGGRFDRSNATFDGQLVRYDKRNPTVDMEWIDYGILAMSRDIVVALPTKEVVDLADVLTERSSAGELAGFEATRRFYEIGTPSSLREFESAVRAGSIDPLAHLHQGEI